MPDLLFALCVLVIVGLIVLAVYCWVGCETDAVLHAEAVDPRPFDPAKTAGGCAGKSWSGYAALTNPDRELEVPPDAATETHR
jgi:hypothetical protein